MKNLKQILFFLIISLLISSCSKEKEYPVKDIVLTFDDAPNFPENTRQILDVLQKHQTKATFFCVGQSLRLFPDLANRLASEQYIANHTYTHINIADSDLSLIYEGEIEQTQILIDSLQPSNGKFFRPPYGKLKSQQKQILINNGFRVIMWDLSAEEWNDNVSTKQVLDYFHNNLLSSARTPVIQFHLNKSTIEALDILLGEFEEMGIEVISLQEL